MSVLEVRGSCRIEGKEDPIFGRLPVQPPNGYERFILDSSGLPSAEREEAWSMGIVNGRYYTGFTKDRDVELIERGLKPSEDFEIVLAGFLHMPAAMKKMLALGYKTMFAAHMGKESKEWVTENLTPYRAKGVAEEIVDGMKKTENSGRRALIIGDKHTSEYDVGGMLPTAEVLASNGVKSVGMNLEFFHPDEARNIPANEAMASGFLKGSDELRGYHPGVYDALRKRLMEYDGAGIKVIVRGLETSCLPK